jgi:hypothetical protein
MYFRCEFGCGMPAQVFWIIAPSAILAETQIELMQKRPPYSRPTAEMLAVQALAFIAEDNTRLSGFIVSTGIAVQSIRDAAREPNFLAGVLEHILADENLLIAFADSAGINPAEVARARQALGEVWERDLP